MNIKLVIVWASAIVVLAIIGLLGYSGKDILVDETEYNKEYVPVSTNVEEHTCTTTTDKADISYTFGVQEGSINKILITYKTLQGDSPSLEAAVESLKARVVSGLGVSYNFDSERKFTLKVSISPSMVDANSLSLTKEDADILGIIMRSEASYNTYLSLLNAAGTYNCN